MIQILRVQDYQVMPWKNGLGVSTEIAIAPAGASLKELDFIWRLSSAQLKGDSAFSKFPGYNRILAVLQGPGVQLNQIQLLPFHSLHFQGEESIFCHLLNKELVVDIGLIYRRDKIRAEMQFADLDNQTELQITSGIHFFRGLSEEPSMAQLSVNGLNLAPGETLMVVGPEIVTLNSVVKPMKYFHLQVHAHPGQAS